MRSLIACKLSVSFSFWPSAEAEMKSKKKMTSANPNRFIVDTLIGTLKKDLKHFDELSQKMDGVSNYSPSPANCRWFSMTLLAFTHTIVVALPMIPMPALLDENAHNLGLNLFKSDGSGALVS